MIKSTWYQKLSIMTANDDDLLKFHCPRCGSKYTVGPIFDHDERTCLSCGIKLIEWNMIEYIYLIDYEKAPAVVRNIVDYLEKFGENEANKEVKSLVDFLCFDDS